MTGKGYPKILKLVDKEVIGVLQQKLCKIILLNLQTSFQSDLKNEKTKFYLTLLKNLLKCSPPEAPILI